MGSTLGLAAALVLFAGAAHAQVTADQRGDLAKINGLRLSLESYATDGAATVQADIQSNLEGEELCAREVKSQATHAADSAYTAEGILGLAWLMRDPVDVSRAHIVSRSMLGDTVTELGVVRGRLRDLDPMCAPYPIAVAKLRGLATLVDQATDEFTAIQEQTP